MKKTLVVGQTPPPYGGQAMMIQYMLDASYRDIKLYHVRMCFSREFTERGRISLYKVLHLIYVVFGIWRARILFGTKTLYYPLSSSPKVAVLRDAIILFCTRFLFSEVVYHFHAAGICEELPRYGFILRKLIYGILSKPSLSITSSEHNPKDGEYLKSENVVVLPLGIPDENNDKSRTQLGTNPHLTVLFMGLLNQTKGEVYLLKAVDLLNRMGFDLRLIIAGRFESEIYQRDFESLVEAYGLNAKVEYRGVLTGADKRKAFLDADVFCFPSFFASESFGIVLLEAMMYQMPIIASRWRGIQSVVEENKNGFLVDVKNDGQIVDALMKLYKDRDLLRQMGIYGRKLYEDKYELARYIEGMEKILSMQHS